MAVTAFPLATLVRAFDHGVIGEEQANNTSTRAERIGRLSRLTCPSPGHLTHRLRGSGGRVWPSLANLTYLAKS